MKYTITLLEKDGRYIATAVDDEKNEHAASDAADPFHAIGDGLERVLIVREW